MTIFRCHDCTPKPAVPGLFLLFVMLALALSGCSNLPQRQAATHTKPAVNAAPAPQPTQARLSSWEQDAPLFRHWSPVLDPADTLLSQEWAPPRLSTASPRLVGQLPGQRELPRELFEEAASPHNPVEEGTLVFDTNEQPADLWDRLRRGFDLPHELHPRIDAELKWYARHQRYLERVSERARRYLYLIVEEVEKRGMPSEIALLPVVESAFQPFAYSHGRAAGIWQFIPSTGRLYGLKQNWWYDGRRDILASTRAALTLLQRLHRQFDGDWLLALAAYNSGQGTVQKAIRKNKRRGKPTDFWSLDLPRETRGYVPRLLALSILVEAPQKYQVRLPSIPNEPYLAQVEVDGQIDLALAADLAGISIDELYLLNPGFNRWATDPEGPHALLVPVDKAETFRARLRELPPQQRVSWKRHRIRPGESLLQIAKRYNTTVELIKDVNAIRGNLIRAGKNLIIPVSTRHLSNYTLSAEQRLSKLQNTRRSGRKAVKYRVRRGDTLWDISRSHGVSVRALAKWNGLAPRDTLRPGQTLVIWTRGENKRRAGLPRTHLSRRTVTQKVNYRVRRGDSLARISRKFQVELRDLLRWNGLSPKKYLQPGQQLTLYVDVTRQAGNI